jgi:2-polyprenyl-6-methoxyphenol hydroxylase-like FAD-dependent oxidoreductase
MTTLKKILVVGGGIAGSTVCYWLKKYGFSPTLIEKYDAIRKGGQALDIRGVATNIVKKIGIYEQIYNRRTQVELGRYVDAEGNTLHEEKGERFGFRQGDEVEIVRGDLVQILMKTIEDVPRHFNQSIESIEQNDNDTIVTFKDGRTEHYDLVIGADGIYSATRRMIFNASEYQLLNLGAYLCVYSIPNYLNLSHTEVLHESDQKLAIITSDEDPSSARAGFMFRSQKVLKDVRDENEQKQFMRDTFQDFGWETQKMLALMPGSDNFYFDAITQVKMNSWTKGRVALLGDAGYCASPLSGQGTNLALVGAYILAGELKAAAGDHVRAFQQYNELLRPFVDANQQFGVWVSESFLTPEKASKEVAEERSNKILQIIKVVSNSITLPEYN